MPARTRSHSSGPSSRGPARPKRGGGKVPPFPPAVPPIIQPHPPPPTVPPTTGPRGRGAGASTAATVVNELEKYSTRLIRFLKTTVVLTEDNYADYIVRH